MKGTEKIIEHIKAEGEAAAKKVLDAAAAQAEEIRAEGFKTALEEHEKLLAAGKAECEEIVSSSRRMAQMEAKKGVLAVKQELVEDAFDAALGRIVDMPAEQYTEFLARMAADAAADGTEEIVLNARDRENVGKAVCKAANELLASRGKTGKLTVSEDTANISAGVIVRFGGIETNCSADAIIRQQRAALATPVAQILFE